MEKVSNKILTVIGTRPQFIKSCLLSKELEKNNYKEVLVHTGQHYDDNMSSIFFKDLKLSKPKYFLGIKAKTHGEMTGKMLIEIEKVVLKEKPSLVIVYGDCNTTLSAALVAKKLHIPLMHVESGLRSYDKSMPEEINRVVTDHISDFLICPNSNSKSNLNKEGVVKNISVVGDLMIELLRNKLNEIKQRRVYKKYNVIGKKYYVATIHRQKNTTPKKIAEILSKFGKQKLPVIFCIHPRTEKIIKNNIKIKIPKNIITSKPLGFLDILSLIYHSRAVFTDSGGLQKEAYELKVPCFTVRETTEWIELVKSGWNFLGIPENISEKINKILKLKHPQFYQNNPSKKIVDIIAKNIIKRNVVTKDIFASDCKQPLVST